MTTTKNTTKTSEINRTDEIAITYFQHNLQMINRAFESEVLCDGTKQKIANVVNEMAELFTMKESCINNLTNDERLKNLFDCIKIAQLSLIGQITKF